MADYYDGYEDGSQGYCRRDSDPWSTYSVGYRDAERDAEESYYRRVAERRRAEREAEEDAYYASMQPEPPYPEPTEEEFCEAYGHPFEHWKVRSCLCGKVKRSVFACYLDLFKAKISYLTNKKYRDTVRESTKAKKDLRKKNPLAGVWVFHENPESPVIHAGFLIHTKEGCGVKSFCGLRIRKTDNLKQASRLEATNCPRCVVNVKRLKEAN